MELGTFALVVVWLPSVITAVIVGRWKRRVELALWPAVLMGPVGLLLGVLLISAKRPVPSP